MITLVLDTETSGLTLPSVAELGKQPRIIDIGIVRIEDGAIMREDAWLVNPGEVITEEITKITGITNEMVLHEESFLDRLPKIIEAFRDADQLIAHNAPFDTACLRYELVRCGDAAAAFRWPETIICSVQEYVHEFGFRPKLTDLYERKMGRPLAQTHRALDDARALAEIVLKEELA